MSRYGNVEFAFNLDVEDGFNLYAKARQENDKDRRYLVWAQLYKHFDDKSFMSFEDFCNASKKKVIVQASNKRPAKDLLEEAKAIKQRIESR